MPANVSDAIKTASGEVRTEGEEVRRRSGNREAKGTEGTSDSYVVGLGSFGHVGVRIELVTLATLAALAARGFASGTAATRCAGDEAGNDRVGIVHGLPDFILMNVLNEAITTRNPAGLGFGQIISARDAAF